MPAGEGPIRLPHEPPRRQFSLGSVFFFVLFISPLLLSLELVREQLHGREPDHSTVYRILALAAVYGGVFAGRMGIRKHRNVEVRPGGRNVSAAAEGGAYGLLFAIMALGPPLLVGVLTRNGAFELGSAAVSAAAISLYVECLFEFLLVLFVLAFEGLVLGAIGGCLADAVLICWPRSREKSPTDDQRRAKSAGQR